MTCDFSIIRFMIGLSLVYFNKATSVFLYLMITSISASVKTEGGNDSSAELSTPSAFFENKAYKGFLKGNSFERESSYATFISRSPSREIM